MDEPKYPDVYVPLVGENSNAYSILHRVDEALRRGKVPADERSAFLKEATSGDYGHLLRTVCEWVTVSEPEDEW